MLTKYKWPIIAGAIAILAVGYIFYSPPSLKDKYNRLRGEYDEARRVAAATEAIRLATIAELEQGNALLQSSIDSANTVIARLEEAQGDKDAAILNLEHSLAQATTDAERVPILTAMVEEWKGKFTLAQAEIAEKDRIIFSLTEQYRSALRIGGEYRSLWETEKALRLKAEVGLNLADKRISSLNRTIKLTRAVALAAVVATIFLKR